MDEESFDLIYWEGTKYVMDTRLNIYFATFYTNHVIGFFSVRYHLHIIDASIPNVCPCCNCPDKTTFHILLCNDKDRTKLYSKSVLGIMS